MRTLEDQETEQLRRIDELADLDARGIAQHLQRITDDVKYDVHAVTSRSHGRRPYCQPRSQAILGV